MDVVSLEMKTKRRVWRTAHIRCRLGVSSFAENNVLELLVIPSVHRVVLLVVGVGGAALSVVRVQVLLLGLSANVLVVRELALYSTRTEEDAVSRGGDKHRI